MNIAKTEKKVKATRARSAWGKGVKEYALELLASLDGFNGDARDISTEAQLEEALLGGASGWNEYSSAGFSLIFDCDIAERLCTKSELKRTQGGRLEPNGRENWIEVQARALRQAWWLIRDAFTM